MKIILSLLLCFSAYSNKNVHEYKKAIKQYVLEYTVFGVDECLKKNLDQIAFDKSEVDASKVLVGSKEYFDLLSRCFNDDISKCKGKCLTKNSMNKRIENIQHLRKIINKSH